MPDAPHDAKAEPDRTNEAPAGKEPENPWAFLVSPPKEEPERKDVLRVKDVSKSWLTGYILKKGCLSLLLIFAALVACDMFLTSSKYHHDAQLVHANAMRCASWLKQISESLDCLTHPDKMQEPLSVEVEPVEITPDMTIADLIREVVRQRILREKDLRCPRCGEPYLVFSEPVSVLLTKTDSHNRIPIVMDPPHAHDESRLTMFICRLFHMHSTNYAFTARVLYANGTIGTLSREEAEKLVAEKSPVPLQLDPEPETEEKPE